MTSAIQRWKDQVQAHHAQSLRAQDQVALPEDFWRPFASFFRADPRRTGDPVLRRLAQDVDPAKTLLDVGGGAGRFALPLALAYKHVTVIEPSRSMLKELRASARAAGISNLSIVRGTWEEVRVRRADVLLCSHVLYGVADIVPFVRKLESSARSQVLVLMFMDAPQARLSPFWKLVHKEKRIDLPGLPELLHVLWEMEIYPDLEMVEASAPPAFESREAAIAQLRQRLYVAPDTEKDRRLHQAMDKLLVKTSDAYAYREPGSRHQGLLSWRPVQRKASAQK